MFVSDIKTFPTELAVDLISSVDINVLNLLPSPL